MLKISEFVKFSKWQNHEIFIYAQYQVLEFWKSLWIPTWKSEGFDLPFIERGSEFEDEQRQSRSRDDGEQREKQKSIATEEPLDPFPL